MSLRASGILLLLLLVSLSGVGQVGQEDIRSDLRSLVELMIQRSPILVRQGYVVQQSKAERRLAKGLFDFNLTSGVSLIQANDNLFQKDPRFESIGGDLLTHTSNFRLGLDRTFRTGLQSSLSFNYSRVASNLPLDQFGETTPPFLADNISSLSVSLSQPLLRGRGKKNTAATERFTIKMVESESYGQDFVLASEVYRLVVTYWSYLASYQRLQIFKQNEERIKRVFTITQELVNAEKRSQNTLTQIKADLANQQRQTVLAEQAYFQSKLSLGRIIGLSEKESKMIVDPVQDFPDIIDTDYSNELPLEKYLDLAKNLRTDIKSLRSAREALEQNLVRSMNDLKPQVDLIGRASIGGIDQRLGSPRIISPFSQTQGRSSQFEVGLNFSFPVNNNVAQASYLSSKTAVDDQNVNIDNQIRNLNINIDIALNNLHFNATKLERARENLNYSQQVYDAEQIKFKNGLTTLLNLILFQDRLTIAQLDYLNAKQEFTSSIADLRNETGTLVPFGEQGQYTIDSDYFFKVP
ncbi:MAG: TolC family protein [Bacteroidia bacterium]|nr:TolC family protein [Bacteroidia bacterium]